jgi:RNA polymerase sigma-70 factor (ECF subfamily)
LAEVNWARGAWVEGKPRVDKVQAPEHDEIGVLLEKARAGDRQAFKSIVTTYQQKVFLLAYSYLRNREDAQDVVQETFMRLYQKLAAYDREKNFQSWLLQIAKNLCIDYYRKNLSKRREMERDASLDDLNPAAPRGESDPLNSDLREVFSRGLARLGKRQRLVFVMKHYNGLDYREIAQVLNISLGTVKSLHFKAVQNLRSALSPQLGMER